MAKGDQLYLRALKEARNKKPKWHVVQSQLERASDLGNGKAIYALGTWYLHGRVYKKDFKKAVELLKVACDKNIPDAHFDLAVCFEKGKGIKKNLREAFLSYLRAFCLGDKDAAYEIGRCYYHGLGVKADKEIGKIWLAGFKKTNSPK
jgi:uncharacterized protein